MVGCFLGRTIRITQNEHQVAYLECSIGQKETLLSDGAFVAI